MMQDDFLAKRQFSGVMGMGRSVTAPPGIVEATLTLRVEDRSVGKIIGPGGAHIKRIRTTSGCAVRTDSADEAVDNCRHVTITGMPLQISDALILIDELCRLPDQRRQQQQMVQNMGGQMGGNMGGNMGSNMGMGGGGMGMQNNFGQGNMMGMGMQNGMQNGMGMQMQSMSGRGM